MKHSARCVLALTWLQFGCAANPEQTVYVLSAPVHMPGAPPQAAGTLVLKLRPVMLPDYLDTTDLLTRRGRYGIDTSRTARWGERLSKGVTNALADDLGHRLPYYVVTQGPAAAPSITIQVTVGAFDVTDAASVLTASWTVTRPDDAGTPTLHAGTFTSAITPGGGNQAIVAAMANAVDDLADNIARTSGAGKKEVFFFEKKKQKTFALAP